MIPLTETNREALVAAGWVTDVPIWLSSSDTETQIAALDFIYNLTSAGATCPLDFTL